MDTSTAVGWTDTLGRRVVPRHFRSLEGKSKMIAESRLAGASVGAIALARGKPQPVVCVTAPARTGYVSDADPPTTAEAAGC